jgi:hypothetical protein
MIGEALEHARHDPDALKQHKMLRKQNYISIY